MSILTVAWSMVSSMGLLLGVIHLLIWLRDRRRVAYLLAAIMATGAGFLALLELGMMTRKSPADYEQLLLWANLAIFTILVPLTWFVHLYFGSARRWLAIIITAAWTLSILINFVLPGNLTFSNVEALHTKETFWGEQFAMAVGTANPLKIIPDVTSFLIVIYVADASVRAYRRGHQRKALMVGGSILFFIVVAGIHTPLVDAGLIGTPFMISFIFTAIALAMAVELVNEVGRAAVYGRALMAWEKKWQSLLNGISLAVIGVDRHGRINYVNPFFRALTGFSEPELLGRLAVSLAPRNRLAEAERWIATVGIGGVPQGIQFPIETTSGAKRDLVWSPVALQSANGEYDGLISVGEDITDRLLAQAALHRTQREMERLTRAIILGELASALAHELNQPLAAILANARAAQRMLEAEPRDLNDVRETLADIVADDKRAGEVIERMRRMLSSGEIVRERFDLNSAIREVLDLTEGETKRQEVLIKYIPTPATLEIEGGRIEIQQVVMNLLLNSARAVSERPVAERRVRIETHCSGNFASIVVLDSGPGVSDEIANRIFDPFVTTKKAGLGMGLAISRRIVEAHGGRIAQANANLGGARFEVSLPLPEYDKVSVDA